MFGSTVLEVIAGLAFCYFSVSLIVSSVNEALASFFQLRARSLLNGVQSMLNDPQCKGLALQIYNHARVNPLGSGTAQARKELSTLPAYIPSQQFAQALLDILRQAQQPGTSLAACITNPPLREFIESVLREAEGDERKILLALAQWFDHAMERVSGAYKRHLQWITLGVALVLAAILNIDSVYLFKTLWLNGSVKPELYSAVPTSALSAIESLQQLPLGWTELRVAQFCNHGSARWLMLGGWCVTALAALFGAPFWFDILQKVISLRGTGAKPQPTPALPVQPVPNGPYAGQPPQN